MGVLFPIFISVASVFSQEESARMIELQNHRLIEKAQSKTETFQLQKDCARLSAERAAIDRKSGERNGVKYLHYTEESNFSLKEMRCYSRKTYSFIDVDGRKSLTNIVLKDAVTNKTLAVIFEHENFKHYAIHDPLYSPLHTYTYGSVMDYISRKMTH